MIGIAQNNLRLYILEQLLLRNRFHAAYRAYRHKDRRDYFPMAGGHFSGSRLGNGIGMLQFKL